MQGSIRYFVQAYRKRCRKVQFMRSDRHFGLYQWVFLVQLTDSTSKLGVIAFFVTTDGIKQADIVYGNLRVYPIA
jgi:hypothetical protein